MITKIIDATATLADVMRACNDLDEAGYDVHIEYKNKRIMVHGGDREQQTLKKMYADFASHPPAWNKWDEYEQLMLALEEQLRRAGEEL